MPNIFDYYSHADLGIDPDDSDLNHGHCPGPAYPGAKGCGRFLVAGQSHCAQCKAESDEWWARDAAYEVEQNAQQQAELAKIEDWPTQAAYYAELPDEDLPF